MLQTWAAINIIMAVLFTLTYSYQFLYLLVPFIKRRGQTSGDKIHIHNYAVLIPARNEERVIAHLISSIRKQTYPEEKITIFVAADNCTDSTAACARNAGAVVWERFDKTRRGKGYVLDFLFKRIFASYRTEKFDGFFVFDADNLLDENYISEMNKTFSGGHKIITSYRNSKNYAANWLSAGSSLWFLRESRYMNNSRMLLGSGCAVSGTGFLVSADVVRRNGGWPFFLLTEDIEFSVHCAIAAERIAFCPTAIFYDEQPVTFRQSWNQRLRWARGFYQVFGKYGGALIKTTVKKRSFFAFDMFMTTAPCMVFTAVSMLLNVAIMVMGALTGRDVSVVTGLFLSAVLTLYTLLFVMGGITAATEWKMIHCRAFFKIAYLFTFPLFMFTYLPIALTAMFANVEWKPITHNAAKTLRDVRSGV